MTFKKRQIDISLTLKKTVQQAQQPTLDDGRSNSLQLKGHRVEVVVENPGGMRAAGNLNMRIFGMKLEDMNAFSTDPLNTLAVRNDEISVSAGDEGGPITKVFGGTILNGCIDFSGVPEVSFNVFARAAFFHQVDPSPANSFQGSVSVADIIKALATQIGHAFENYGVTTMIRDQSLSGTVVDQIRRVAAAAGIVCSIEMGVVAIWPSNGTRGSGPIEVNPSTGMVGYPWLADSAIYVKTEFNPTALFGRKVRISSSKVARANGNWACYGARHELSTMTPNGPWFTTMRVAREGAFQTPR